jgi:hypothetical protein
VGVKRRAGLALCLTFVVSACSGDDDATSTGRVPSGTTRERPSAEVRIRGVVGLEGAVSQPSIRCNVPDLEGSSIAVLGQPQGSTLQTRIGVQRDRVEFVVSSGSAPSTTNAPSQDAA